jgi:SRSO17 transposase
MSTRAEARDWARGLDELVARLALRFGRVEPRRRARAYLGGLIAPLERKNGWQLAEAAGDRTPDGIQDFLSRMRWDADLVREDLRSYVVEHLGDPAAVLVLDETGFLKKGSKSVGVQRQYSGTAGRIENCQIGVFLGYASRHGHALIDRALYLPESWAKDRARRREAGVPEAVAFATKPKLGRQMLERALDAGVPCAFVTGDSVYGADSSLRRIIGRRGRGYVLAVTSAQRLAGQAVSAWAEDVSPEAWMRLSAGEGAKGPRVYDWAHVPVGRTTAAGWQKGLLIRRKIGKPEDLAFYLTYAPAQTTTADLVRVAGTRWTIEASFEAAKGEVGLDQYEVRSWTGWHRHITLAMLAYAYLAAIRKAAAGGTGRRGSQGGAVAADGTGGAPPALASGVGSRAQGPGGFGVVALAATPSATRSPLPLATANSHP